jgi:hypothetical protein
VVNHDKLRTFTLQETKGDWVRSFPYQVSLAMSGIVKPITVLVKRNDLKYERNEIIALLAKALLEKAVSRNYVRGANS